MALPLVVLGVTGLLVGGGLLVKRSRAARATTQGVQQGPAPEGQKPPGLGGLLKGLLKKGGAGGAAGTAATVLGGLTLNEALGRLTEATGAGKGKADVVRVGGIAAALPILAGRGAAAGLGALGVDDPQAQKTAEQVTGGGVAGAVLTGAGATAGAVVALNVGIVKGLDWALGKVAPGVQDVVHDVFRPFDVTNPNALAGKPVAAVANVVEAVGGTVIDTVTGLFGGGVDPAQLAAAQQVLAGQVATGNVLGLKVQLPQVENPAPVFAPTQPNRGPIGFLDAVSPEGVASGWALDPDTATTPVEIHFYMDGPPGTGTFAGRTVANLPRQDVNRGTGYAGDHGFRWALPAEWKDGRKHQLHAWAIDTGREDNPAPLAQTPWPFTLGTAPAGTGGIKLPGFKYLTFETAGAQADPMDDF